MPHSGITGGIDSSFGFLKCSHPAIMQLHYSIPVETARCYYIVLCKSKMNECVVTEKS